MSKNIQSISLKNAQKIMYCSQLLNLKKCSTLKAIKNLGYVQLDTISVVKRAHHHTLWTRNSRYQVDELHRLMKRRKVFEYWSHAASILPMSDYRFSLYKKKLFRDKFNKSSLQKDKKMRSFVLKRIKEEGPLQSRDFKNESKKGNTGWWDWKPAKRALERLFMDGELEVSYRDSFRKVYDLPERVVPAEINTKMPTENQYFSYLIDRVIRSHGLARLSEIGYLCGRSEKNSLSQVAKNMLDKGLIQKVCIENLPGAFLTTQGILRKKLEVNSEIHIFSPFDNFVIQRKKLQDFYNFKYQIECYVPEKKRKFGYFCLPIFRGISPLGRIDCKADRKSGELIVKNLFSENDIEIRKEISKKLMAFANFNDCHKLVWQ